MKILSIQVGLPKEVEFRGKIVTTGIFKSPIEGPVFLKTHNLDGDRQADLTVHGGLYKAVYAYSFDAYEWWKKARPGDVFDYGAMGENLTIDHLPEDQAYIGDTYEVGDAVLRVAQPRYPCYKLGVKFNDPSILKSFMSSGRPGVYYSVVKEGLIEAGQTMKLIEREKVLLSVAELFSMKNGNEPDRARVEEILKIRSLIPAHRAQFEELLE